MHQDRDSRFTRVQQVIATEISADLQQKLAEELNLMQNESEIGSVLLNELAATADAMKNIEDKEIKEFIMSLDYQNIELQADVGGGMRTIMRIFFPTNGFYQLSKNGDYVPKENDNDRVEPIEAVSLSTVDSETRKNIFHEVLKIFLNIKELFKQI